MAATRFRAEPSLHLPAGATNSHHVYDFVTGMVARRSILEPGDDRLAYFPTKAAAREWAARANTQETPGQLQDAP